MNGISGYHIAMLWFFTVCFLAPVVGAWIERRGGQ